MRGLKSGLVRRKDPWDLLRRIKVGKAIRCDRWEEHAKKGQGHVRKKSNKPIELGQKGKRRLTKQRLRISLKESSYHPINPR